MTIIRSLKNIAMPAGLWIYLVISLYPLIYLIFFSLKNNDEIFTTNPLGFPHPIRFNNYRDAVESFDITLYFKNSLIVTLISIIAILILSLMFAYASARMTWKLRSFANSYILIGLFIPTQVILIPLAVFVRDMGISNTYLGLILPYVAFNLAFSSLIFYSFFRTIPMEIEESAFMDGASIYRTFLQIMLPLVQPAVATVTIFSFMNVWNEFTLSLILATKESIKTLPIGLLSFTGQYATNWGPMGAAMVLSSIPVIVVYLILGDQVEKALTVGSAVKG
ncbi:carbohydrate ABC transporter permease [Paenibacillus sp. JDR-2]|uniref:carbohydrate ABC transporter permease n=1 Tax=Paenibacillus sp. (strain JDR-2) TaxID=324057 RepID=UPI0001AAF8E4|nr:carbohydrate ABC transporter permease [Paenibacillus sp. JDR-2]ACT01205.1 binding-protein-dependent transport systems inner membrane component [Paenibacillus sp. JDR-2]